MEATHLARNVTCGMSMAGVGQIYRVRHSGPRVTFWGPSSHRTFGRDQLVTVDVPTDSGESDPYGAEVMRIAGPAAYADPDSHGYLLD